MSIGFTAIDAHKVGSSIAAGFSIRAHRVTVRMPADESTRSMCQVRVETRAPEFEFRSRDGRLKALDGAPPAAAEALKSVPNSPRWNGLKGRAGPDGIELEHKGVSHGDWLLDLWLAERLAATF